MDFATQVSTMIKNAVATIGDRKLTLAEAKSLVNQLAEAISSLAALLNIDSAEKKAKVLLAMGSAFDAIWPKVPLPFGLSVFRLLITPGIRAIFLAIIGADIELIYQRLVKPNLPADPASSNAI